MLSSSLLLAARRRCHPFHLRAIQSHNNIPQYSSQLFSTKINPRIETLLAAYKQIRSNDSSEYLSGARTPREVFANNQLRLSNIDVVGFDYDYTIAHYTDELQVLIYNVARDHLVDRLRYPSNIRSTCTYDPSFAIRGLTIDSQKGLLCKMSSFQKLSYSGVYRGRRRLTPTEIYEEYNGSRHIPRDYRDKFMKPLNDLFSVSHACLFADVIQYFIDNDIHYEPISVFEDIDASIGHVHTSNKMHKAIIKDLPRYLELAPQIRPLLERMRSHGKQLFLCTNSSFRYANAGLRYMMGDDWMSLFDVVMVNSRKPNFYTRNRAFRLIDPEKGRVKWQPVTDLKRGCVYSQGSISQLISIKGWKGGRVLYIGDSLFSDLVEPNRKLGWRTGAIIRDLENEMVIQSTKRYQHLDYQIQALEELLRRVQAELSRNDSNISDGSRYQCESELLVKLVEEHQELQAEMGRKINKNYGSVFRVDSHPSQFAFSVQRYVDIYTSRLENLLDYPDNYTFYPQYQRLPHETKTKYQAISSFFDKHQSRVRND